MVDAVFEALADERRRRLLVAIVEQREATATQLAAGARISRQGVSKHLGALAHAGLVDRVRRGRSVFYRVQAAALFAALGWIADVGAAEALAQQTSKEAGWPTRQ